MKLSEKQLLDLIQDSYLDSRGKNVYGRCPSCSMSEFGVSLEPPHKFGCFRGKCGFRGTDVRYLLKYLGKIKDFSEGYRSEVNVFGRLTSNLEIDSSPLNTELPEIKPPIGWKRVFEDEYLRKRGFTDGDFQKYEVGRSRLKKDYVTFLVKMDGKTVGYVGRSEKSKEWIDNYNKKQKENGTEEIYLRYQNSSTDFSKMLFGIDEVIPGKITDVILVEGIFSKTKTDTNLGLDGNEEMKCLATFGAKLSIEQIELLKKKKVKNIWLWFEADVLDKVKQVASKAALHFNVRISYLYEADPNEIDSEQALSLLENSKDWMDFNMSYLTSKL